MKSKGREGKDEENRDLREYEKNGKERNVR